MKCKNDKLANGRNSLAVTRGSTEDAEKRKFHVSLPFIKEEKREGCRKESFMDLVYMPLIQSKSMFIVVYFTVKP